MKKKELLLVLVTRSTVQEVAREIRGAEGELREEGWYFLKY
jgi:hypothetical protein